MKHEEVEVEPIELVLDDLQELVLDDLQIEELEVLLQDGSRGGPDFAASTACCDSCGQCWYSCAE